MGSLCELDRDENVPGWHGCELVECVRSPNAGKLDPARAVALFHGAADAGDLAARESGREADGEVLVRMLESRGRA